MAIIALSCAWVLSAQCRQRWQASPTLIRVGPRTERERYRERDTEREWGEDEREREREGGRGEREGGRGEREGGRGEEGERKKGKLKLE